MARLLYRIGRFTARHHVWVLVVWGLILVGALAGGQFLGGVMSTTFTIPGTQAQSALDMLDQRFPQASGASVRVIYAAPQGQQVSAFQGQIQAANTAIAALPDVSGVTGPFDKNASGQISANGEMAYSTVQYTIPSTSITTGPQDALVQAADAAAQNGLTVAFSGLPDPPSSTMDYTEAIGLVVAFIVLIITFGSLLAAGMPLVTALIGVGVATSVITIASGFIEMSSTAPLLATMLGLAVGIDYALFIVSRHRSQLAQGVEPRESIALAVSTAGSAVSFAGLTVIIALLGLSVVQIPFLSVMGIGAAIAVVVAVLVALTLLPALLATFGRLLRPRRGGRAERRELSAHGAEDGATRARRTLGTRWVRLVTARPVITLVVTVVALLVLALPALSMRLTLPDAGYNPPDSRSRQGYDLLSQGFGPGVNGPLLVTADISSTMDIQGALDALHDAFTGLDDVASVSPAIPNPTVDMAIVSIIPDSAPDSQATADLVQQIRAAEPAFAQAHGFGYQVTGQTALGIDVSDRLEQALLPFALVVVGLCIVLLAIVFRSIAVPLSATIGYLLSVIVSFGVVTAVFEWGWAASFFTVGKVGPVISFMPILVMAVLFGLAMDYHVFLVSRMREEYAHRGDAAKAVRAGFVDSARVVTAAACIMFAVFASFVPGGNAILQPVAFALAAGVFIDAFVVRMTLIPAAMMLLGRHAWWLPGWLDRVMPDVDLEGVGVHRMLRSMAWRPASAMADEPGDARSDDETELAQADAPRPAREEPVVASDALLVEQAQAAPLALRIPARALALLEGESPVRPEAVAAALAGRQRVAGGELRVLGCTLPYEAAALRRNSLYIGGPGGVDPALEPWLREVERAVLSGGALFAVDAVWADQKDLPRILATVLAAAPPEATVVVALRAAPPVTAAGRDVQVIALAPRTAADGAAATAPASPMEEVPA